MDSRFHPSLHPGVRREPALVPGAGGGEGALRQGREFSACRVPGAIPMSWSLISVSDVSAFVCVWLLDLLPKSNAKCCRAAE